MPRIRSIKPDFFKSEDVSALPLRARLTWIGLWTQCDDHGRYKDSARLIKGDLWSLDDVSLRDIDEDLAALAAARRIVRYEVNGARYLAVVNWHGHQAINRPSKAKHPAPPWPMASADPNDANHCTECSQTVDNPPSLNGHGALTPGGEGKGREGKGRARERSPTPDKPPSPKCPDHEHQRKPPPCGRCADARKALAEWEAERDRRVDEAPKCRQHRGQLADNCGPCRSERLATGGPA